jgi:hypothetical protein
MSIVITLSIREYLHKHSSHQASTQDNTRVPVVTTNGIQTMTQTLVNAVLYLKTRQVTAFGFELLVIDLKSLSERRYGLV